MSEKQRSHYSSSQWTKVRASVLARDGYTCAYCGSVEANTVDHVVPLSKGGEPFNLDNLVACCSRCNSKKRDKSAFFLEQSPTPPVLFGNLSPLTTATTPISPIATIND